MLISSVPGAANVNSSGLVVNNQFTVGGDIDLNGSSEAIINGVLTSPIVNVNNVSSLIVNNPGTVAANVNVGPSALLAIFGTINGNVTNAGFFQGTGVVNGNVVNSGHRRAGNVHRKAHNQRQLHAERERHLAYRSGRQLARPV